MHLHLPKHTPYLHFDACDNGNMFCLPTPFVSLLFLVISNAWIYFGPIFSVSFACPCRFFWFAKCYPRLEIPYYEAGPRVPSPSESKISRNLVVFVFRYSWLMKALRRYPYRSMLEIIFAQNALFPEVIFLPCRVDTNGHQKRMLLHLLFC